MSSQLSFNYDLTPCSYFVPYKEIDVKLKNRLLEDDSEKDIKRINLFIDTRGVLSRTHVDEEKVRIIKNYNMGQKFIILKTLLALANHWVRYFNKYNKTNVKIIFFGEHGSSVYHDVISNGEYKKQRKNSKSKIDPKLLEGLRDLKQDYANVFDSNMRALRKIAKYSDKLYSIYLKDLEADFVPHFILSNYNTKMVGKNKLNIILSGDKDLLQTTKFQNTYLIKKIKNYEFFNRFNSLKGIDSKLTKDDKELNKQYNLFSIILSLIGDKVDEINGIKGLGINKVYTYLHDLYTKGIITKEDSTISHLIDKINKFQLKDSVSISIIASKQLLEKNMKLIDFEMLIEDKRNHNHLLEIKENLEETRNTDSDEVERLLATLFENKHSYLSLL